MSGSEGGDTSDAVPNLGAPDAVVGAPSPAINRGAGAGPPGWQDNYDLMDSNSCHPTELAEALFPVIQVPKGNKRGEDGSLLLEPGHAIAGGYQSTAPLACDDALALLVGHLKPYGIQFRYNNNIAVLAKIACNILNVPNDPEHGFFHFSYNPMLPSHKFQLYFELTEIIFGWFAGIGSPGHKFS